MEVAGSASRVLDRDLPDDLDDAERAIAAHAAEAVTGAYIEKYRKLIGAMEQEGVRLVTVLDKDYPALLREIYNRPPFLFVRGELSQADEFAVSVVGIRRASTEGLGAARRLAAGLAQRGVTVVSGLAAGIDTVAHEAALEAGGRTIAVLGTGIRRIYPAQNLALAERIVQRGAVLSQFWPDAPPTRCSFLIRNVVTSGMGIGTVVIEAHGNSGAKSQARHCLDHGKQLFLIRQLVMHEEWAQRYSRRPGVTVVDTVDDVAAILTSVASAPRQLSLC